MDSETSHVEHHLHQVFSDIVDIALDDSDHHLPFDSFLHFFGFEMRTEDVEPCIQGIRTHQDFGDEVLLFLIEISNNLHASSQPIHDGVKRVESNLNRLICRINYLLVFEINNPIAQPL